MVTVRRDCNWSNNVTSCANKAITEWPRYLSLPCCNLYWPELHLISLDWALHATALCCNVLSTSGLGHWGRSGQFLQDRPGQAAGRQDTVLKCAQCPEHIFLALDQSAGNSALLCEIQCIRRVVCQNCQKVRTWKVNFWEKTVWCKWWTLGSLLSGVQCVQRDWNRRDITRRHDLCKTSCVKLGIEGLTYKVHL